MRLTRRFRDYRHAAALEQIATSFLPRFPELKHLDFELDLLPSSSWHLGVTEQDRLPPRIRLRPARPTNPSLTYVIPHEFTHLLQRPLGIVPSGERSCDLYALARAGESFAVSPGYLRVPRLVRPEWPAWASVAASLAREALAERSAGRRTYISWWEASFREQVAASVASREKEPSAQGGSRTL